MAMNIKTLHNSTFVIGKVLTLGRRR